MSGGRRVQIVLALSIVVLGALPILACRWVLDAGPSVTVEEAQRRLRDEPLITLVDLRTPTQFRSAHVPGAVNWPAEEIELAASSDDVPPDLHGNTLLLLCDAGFLSAQATRKLRQMGVPEVFSVAGGMQQWIAFAVQKACAGTITSANLTDAKTAVQPGSELNAFRISPVFEQWAAIFSGFTLKPIYMLLALVLAYVLRKRKDADLSALRWALLFFFVGEAFCYANFFAYRDTSALFEYLHSYGMVLAFGFGTFAFFEGLDARIMGLTDPEAKCAAVLLCRSCVKYADATCGLQRTFEALIPLFVVLACFPFFVEPQAVSYNTLINGLPYNYSHPVLHQLYEIRYCPAIAIGLMALAWFALRFKKDNAVLWAKILFSAGFGFFSFGLLRLILFAPFRDNLVWFGFWEEVTELLSVVGITLILWIFRRGLFRKQDAGQT